MLTFIKFTTTTIHSVGFQPRGVAWKGNTLFVSETILQHMPKVKEGEQKPKLLSGVYGFNLDIMQSGTIQLIPYDQNNQGPRLVVKFEPSGRVGFGQY